ncbi:MAG TPA: acetylglutamate kinase [Bacillota bacterium]|nr:acetylglutamate kinase [Bacillota bacterium]HOL09134.1 acetylglutamate kinase [Bacillota bacterium]HPO97191.1 acetylglutamate kinase [Bacillota bacterium]
MESLIAKANVLVEAVPYIRTFYGKTFVIKYGGNAMINEELKKGVMQDVVLLKFLGVNPVLIHGGGPEINQMLKRVGKQSQFVQGLRVTDAETMEIVQMVLVGKLNKEIVSQLNLIGGKAVGLSGQDANLILARKTIPTMPSDYQGEIPDIGFVGEVADINTAILNELIDNGYIPVISSIGVGSDGVSYNINADTAAGELAAALKAEKLIMLTDVEGIFEDYNDKSSLISALKVDRAYQMINEGKIDGGMIPKVEACIKALQSGVRRTHIIDGRQLHSMLLEILTDKGIGTMVV